LSDKFKTSQESLVAWVKGPNTTQSKNPIRQNKKANNQANVNRQLAKLVAKGCLENLDKIKANRDMIAKIK
jgi:hypothetical protein